MATENTKARRVDGEESERPSDTMVVGIGASAGGLPALQMFFSRMPAGHGLAFVVIQHLDPHVTSLMPKLLSEHAAFPVIEATDGTRVEPDHVYTIPSGFELRIHDGLLGLRPRVEGRAGNFPVDTFLCTLADDQRSRAIAVILTGSGSDGATGVREVKAHGGVAFAQSPGTAEQAGMPEAAIASGAVDVVADLEELPDRIVAYARHLRGFEHDRSSIDGLDAVLKFLGGQTGMDLSAYKLGTLTRRIQRRMGLRRSPEPRAYLSILREDREELERLRSDILIGVTSFFRDPEAFAAVEREVVPNLFVDREETDEVRVWVSACSTGEEAYSVAMLLLEERARVGSSVPVRVFATDANEASVDTARAGVYEAATVATLAPDRLERFFVAEPDGRQRVAPDLRKSVTFATQDLLSDPPFPAMDLICCRNVLIYLEPGVQRDVLMRFHFALKPRGYLFLGRTESIPQDAPFDVISRRWRIFRRGTRAVRPTRDLALSPIRPRVAGDADARRAVAPRSRERAASELAAEWLLAAYAPAAVVVNERHVILALHGPVERYLNLPRGEAVFDLLAMPKAALRSQVRTAVYRATREGKPIRVTGGTSERDGETVGVTVGAQPLRAGGASNLFVVTFEETAVAPASAASVESVARPAEDDAYVKELESELRATRDDLHETTETSQAQFEELQAANEEITSMNEELRAANEELMASKEELQALNEEVTNTNDELNTRVQSLNKVTDDLANLLASTGIATLYLDRDFRIVRATPALAELMHVLPSDAGRPVRDITWRVQDPDLLADAQRVLQDMAVSERVVKTAEGHRYARRIAPYRTREGHVEGLFFTWRDVEETLAARQSAEAARDLSEAIVRSLPTPVVILDEEGRVALVNPAFERRFGVAAQQAQGQALPKVADGPWNAPDVRATLEAEPPREGTTEVAWPQGGAAATERFLVSVRPLPSHERAKHTLVAIMEAPAKSA